MNLVDMKYSLDSMFPSKIRLTLSTLLSSCNVIKLLPHRDPKSVESPRPKIKYKKSKKNRPKNDFRS